MLMKRTTAGWGCQTFYVLFLASLGCASFSFPSNHPHLQFRRPPACHGSSPFHHYFFYSMTTTSARSHHQRQKLGRVEITSLLSSFSLPELLQELDSRDIRYPPDATRQDLEQMLITSSAATDEKVKESGTAFTKTHHNLVAETVSPIVVEETSILEILRQLDKRNIRYPPDASPSDLNRLLLRHDEKMNNSVIISDENLHTARSRRMRRNDTDAIAVKPKSSSVVWNHKSVQKIFGYGIPKVSSKALHNARKIAGRANEWIRTDENGIRDVSFEYTKREPISSTTVSPSTIREVDVQTMGKTKRRTRRPSKNAPEAPTTVPGNAPFHNVRGDVQTETKVSITGSGRPKITNGMPTTGTTAPKKIYSPYRTSQKYPNMVEQVGQFLTEAGMSNDPPSSSKRRNVDGASRRHWKDRMEERIDTFLGVHEDSAFYQKWAAREEKEIKEEEGFDAFAVARGRRPKKRHDKVSVKYEKPFWEEEGNIISLVLGRSKSGGSLFYDKLLDPTKGSLLNLFRSITRSILLVATYLFRWASVKDALPQPVVAICVCTAGICAKRRLLAMGLVLIVMRTLGELIHGALYDDEDWETHDTEPEPR